MTQGVPLGDLSEPPHRRSGAPNTVIPAAVHHRAGRAHNLYITRNRCRGLKKHARRSLEVRPDLAHAVAAGNSSATRRTCFISFPLSRSSVPRRDRCPNGPASNLQLDVLDEEIIDTPLGPLRALPIRQVRQANEESLALWLAVEYRYVPVKLKFFDRAGAAQGEQIVTQIRLSED